MKKTVLITGSSRGIGREIAIAFAKEGYNIVINYNQSMEAAIKLSNYLTSIECNNMAIKCDVSSRDQVQEMINKIHSNIGYIDILINNAGISDQSLFTDISEKQWDKIFDINVKGVFNCTQLAVKDMIQNGEGSIINISSIWGMVGASCEVCYSASKSAIIGFTKALAKEIGSSNITVNCIAPGIIDTDMNSNIGMCIMDKLKDETPLGVIGKCQDISNLAVFLASDKARFITGQVISPNGGFVI